MTNQKNKPREQVHLPEKLREWEGGKIVETAKELAGRLKGGLDTQLRRVFDTFRKLEIDFRKEGFNRDEVLLLKPRLAYVVARERKLSPIFTYLDEAIDRVYTEEDFFRLMKFAEAILAYYKYSSATGGQK